MQMEFLNPQFLAASEKPPANYAQQFTFDPGKAKVLDRTQQITEIVAAQVQNAPKSPLRPPEQRAPGAPPQR